MIQAGGPAFKEGTDQDDPLFAGDPGEGVGEGAGNGFRQIAKAGILDLTEIEGGVEFREHDQFGARLGRLLNGYHAFGNIGGTVRAVRMLDQGCFHIRSLSGFGATNSTPED